jgi:dipeptidyl aminopeptidase/acylaminoacyl peptidase
MNADGRHARRIGTGNRPSWSPDGSQIAVATGFPGYPSSVVVLARDGSNQRIVTEGAEPTWSPDGRQLAFVKNESGPCDPTQVVTRIYAINLDGTGETRVTPRVGRYSCDAADEDPDWQPRCTRYGSKRDNRVTGTAGRDVLCALAGRDIIRAGGGDDVVLGGDGKDVIYGGSGKDWLFGGAGNDLILARDGKPAIVNGGPGHDRARIDRGLDRLSGVERVLR